MFWTLIMAFMAAVISGRTPDACDDAGVHSLLKRHEIQVLLKAGFEVAKVATLSGTSVDTVQRVADEPDVTDVDDAAERKRRKIGRPSKAAPFTERVKSWLEDDDTLPTQELLRRANEAGYRGSKTAFYALVAGVRPTSSTPVVRFEGLRGEFSQHDFGQVDVRYVDGTKERVHFFASRLKYSRWVAVSLVEDERVETLLRGLVRHFDAFGGRPLMAVFDRPRTIVNKSGVGRAVEEFNATFAQGIVDIGVGVEMCAARSGNQKGSVERLVGWVKGSFFKPRKFQDRADLVVQLNAWLKTANTATPSRATGQIPETRRLEELPRLRPNVVFPETLALRFPVFVGPSAEVSFEGVSYSMPPEAANVAGTIFVLEDRVRIVAGRWSAEHRRRKKSEPRASLPEHRAAKLAAVHGKRAKLYQKRQNIADLGEDAVALLTAITHRSPQRAAAHVEELHELLERRGDARLRRAIGAAVAAGQLEVARVRAALDQGVRSGEVERARSSKSSKREAAFPVASPARPRRGAAQPRDARVAAKHIATRRADKARRS